MSKLKLMENSKVKIPDKLFFKIGEVCDLVGVQAHVLRYWESEFPQLQPQKNRAGQRTYRRKDIEMALRIKGLLYDEGFTIAKAKKTFTGESEIKTIAKAKKALTRESEVKIPDNLIFKTGEVCELVGVQAHVLRYWESEFPQLQPQKNRAGQRTYRRKDVEMALRIKGLLYNEGYTIAGAKRALKVNRSSLELNSSHASTVSIYADKQRASKPIWRAFAGLKEAFGKTAGEALDSITSKLGDNNVGTVIVRRLLPDKLFTASQQKRLSELMSKWREKRDAGSALSSQEQAELEALVEAELAATSTRSEQILYDLNK